MTRRADHAANLEFVLGEKALYAARLLRRHVQNERAARAGFLGLEFDDRDAFATNPLWEM